MRTTGSPPTWSPAAMQVASSSVAQVTTRIESSLSSAASTVFWCVSGTLRIQPRCVWIGGSVTSAASAALASRNVSFSVSMTSEAGIDSGILSPAVVARGSAPDATRRSPDRVRGAPPRRFSSLLGHAPDAGVPRGPVIPTLDVFPPRHDLWNVDRRIVGQVGPSQLLELGVNFRAVLRFDGLPALLTETVVFRVVVPGDARLRLVVLAVVDIGV